MKNLPYQTVYVELPDIARVSKEAGISPFSHKPDGTPVYTCPAIIDDATGTSLSDSYKIAEYLDKQYPDTPKAFPSGTEALQAAFYQSFNDTVTFPIAFTIVPETPRILKERSREYFYRTREKFFGKPVDQLKPVGEELEKNWEKLKVVFDAVEGWYGKSSGDFMVGDMVSFADFTVASMVVAVKIICGEDSKDWGRFKAMNNGRWTKLLGDLEDYASVRN